MPFVATWMDLQIIVVSKVREKRQISYHITYRWNLIKMVQKNLFEKQKQTDTFQNHCYGSHKWNHWEEGEIVEGGSNTHTHCVK